MSLSILITGGDSISRKEKALSLCEKDSSSFDTHILSALEEGGIGNVREFIQKLNKKPFNSKQSTLIILDGEELTIEAQNALLKTIEEPPSSSKIILTSTAKESLLSTIGSRCREIHLGATTDISIQTKKLEKFLSEDFFDRWQASSRLNLEEWLNYWRGQLLEKTRGGDGHEINNKEELRKITSYVKLILKAKAALKRRASIKLMKNFLLINAPIRKAKKRKFKPTEGCKKGCNKVE